MKLINRIVYPGKIAPYEMGPMGPLGHVRYTVLHCESQQQLHSQVMNNMLN